MFNSIKFHLVSGVNENGKPNSVIDDIYVANTNTDVNNDFLGDVAVDCYFIDQEGIYSEFTSLIDKVTALTDSSDDTYVSGLSTTDTYKLETIYDATPSYDIKGIVEWVRASDEGSSLEFVLDEANTVANVDTIIIPPGFQWYGHPWERTVGTTVAVPFTPTIINDSEFGIRST